VDNYFNIPLLVTPLPHLDRIIKNMLTPEMLFISALALFFWQDIPFFTAVQFLFKKQNAFF
jgi:hypothetical protein